MPKLKKRNITLDGQNEMYLLANTQTMEPSTHLPQDKTDIFMTSELGENKFRASHEKLLEPQEKLLEPHAKLLEPHVKLLEPHVKLLDPQEKTTGTS